MLVSQLFSSSVFRKLKNFTQEKPSDLTVTFFFLCWLLNEHGSMRMLFYSYVSGGQKLKIQVSKSHPPSESCREEFFLILSNFR